MESQHREHKKVGGDSGSVSLIVPVRSIERIAAPEGSGRNIMNG
jgi:hypothetical protein